MKLNLHMLAASLAAGSAMAHMEMKSPYPFRSKFNPDETNVDYSMTNPLASDGELISPATTPSSSIPEFFFVESDNDFSRVKFPVQGLPERCLGTDS